MGGFLSFALPLVELFPQYQWFDSETKTYFDCSRDDAWASGNWQINWESDKSIHNWVSDLDLYCADKWLIGLFGSMYYFGYLIGAIVFVNLSDMYGRKIWTRTSYILHTISFALIIFISNLYSRYVCIFLCGFVGAVRWSVSYTTGCEFLLKKHQIYSSAITQMINAWVPMFLAIYFWKITKHWIYFYYFTLSICIINCILVFYIPESPRWLVSQERYKDAKDSLNEVAKINSKPMLQYDVINQDNKSLSDNEDSSKSLVAMYQAHPLTTIWTHHTHRMNLFLAVLFWFLACVMNYIMNFYVKYIKTNNIFILILLSAIAEFISKTLNGALIKFIGYKQGTLLCISCSIISSVLFLFFYSNAMLIPFIIFGCKLFASASFASMYFACPTLFESKVSTQILNFRYPSLPTTYAT